MKKRLILINLKEIFPINPSEFEIFNSVKSCNKKTPKNWRNFNDTEKRIILKLLQISFLNVDKKILLRESRMY